MCNKNNTTISRNDNNHTQTNKRIPINTLWYRKNKLTNKVVHRCRQCNYSTTGPKIILTNHIYSKHTAEQDRPFQCPCDSCDRGFAQKGSLKKHMEKKHAQQPHENENKTIIEYHIELQNKVPKNKRTKLRYDFYKKNLIITEEMIKKHSFLTPAYILYDSRVGYITAKGYTSRGLCSPAH
jgi:hypothetical protein